MPKETNDPACFILGAGFSCGAGLPLSNNFLDKMNEVHTQYYLGKTLTPLNEPMSGLFRFRAQRRGLFDKTLINNVEFWLSLVSARTLGNVASRGFNKYQMQIAIAQVIEYYVRPVKQCEYVDRFVSYANKSRNSILTLNYDDLVEQACERAGIKYRYGLKIFGYKASFDLDISNHNKEMLDINENPQNLPIFKLHGSYNWIAKNDGPLKLIGDMQNFFFSNQVFWENEWVQHSFVIEPPTIDKMYAGSILSVIWGRAYEALSLSTHITVIGYSFPENDGYVKYLLMASLSDNNNLKSFTFVDPSCCDVSYKARIDWLLGLLKAKAVKITCCNLTAEEWVNQKTQPNELP